MLAVREGVKEADDLTVRAQTRTLILSMNKFGVRKVNQRVTRPHVKFRLHRKTVLLPNFNLFITHTVSIFPH